MAKIESARLIEIENTAIIARTEASESLALLRQELTLHTDLRHVATILAHGDVRSVQNLTHHDGQRLAGSLEWLPFGANICFEAFDPLVRQRFSIAHELGHYFLHVEVLKHLQSMHADPVRLEDEIDLPIVESEADAFAAAFLMPSDLMKCDSDRFGLAMPFLAERYRVSEAAMKRRLKTLQELSA